MIEQLIRFAVAFVMAVAACFIAEIFGVQYGIAFCAGLSTAALWGPLDAKERAQKDYGDSFDDR